MMVSNFNGLTKEQMNKIKLENKVSNFLWMALFDEVKETTYKNGMIVPVLSTKYARLELSDKITVEIDVQALLEGYNNFNYIDYYNFNDSKYDFSTIFNNEVKIFNTKNMQDVILQLKVFLYEYLTTFQRLINDFEMYQDEDDEDYIELTSDVIYDINNNIVNEMFN